MRSYAALTLLVAFIASATAQEQEESNCEVIGYDKGTNPAFIARQDEEVTADIQDCAQLCASTEGCRSLAFGDGTCLLYDVPVEDNVTVMDSSPYLFNDIDCFEGLVVPDQPADNGDLEPDNPDEGAPAQP